MRRLIINADDFGLTAGINRAIIDAHEHGTVTSTTLMAGGRAFDNAVQLAASVPSLSVGCHVVIVDGHPILPASQVSTLLDDDPHFPTRIGQFARRALFGRLDADLVERAAEMGAQLMERIDALRAKHSFIKEVRGKGLIIAIEFHEPSEFKLKMAWKLLHKVDKVLFAQMIVTQMLSKHRILTQVAGHAMDVLKILPPLIIGEKEISLFVTALDNVLTDCRKFPGPMWELGNNFVRAAISSRRSSQAPVVSA